MRFRTGRHKWVKWGAQLFLRYLYTPSHVSISIQILLAAIATYRGYYPRVQKKIVSIEILQKNLFYSD